MRLLDLDLDFFLADTCELAPMGGRPDARGHEPWAAEQVRRFLRERCGLCAPLPGRIFETHDKALLFWKEMMDAGRLNAPFHVTHVDAHSDLAIGRPGPRFILENVLSRRPDRREDIPQYYQSRQLDEANYLLFALAFRWISDLSNVRNPKSRPDIPEQIALRDGRGAYVGLQLVSPVSRLMEKFNGPEPMIPFHVYHDYQTFCAVEPYDFITLAQSPRYAPREADALMDVIGEFILPV